MTVNSLLACPLRRPGVLPTRWTPTACAAGLAMVSLALTAPVRAQAVDPSPPNLLAQAAAAPSASGASAPSALSFSLPRIVTVSHPALRPLMRSALPFPSR